MATAFRQATLKCRLAVFKATAYRSGEAASKCQGYQWEPRSSRLIKKPNTKKIFTAKAKNLDMARERVQAKVPEREVPAGFPAISRKPTLTAIEALSSFKGKRFAAKQSSIDPTIDRSWDSANASRGVGRLLQNREGSPRKPLRRSQKILRPVCYQLIRAIFAFRNSYLTTRNLGLPDEEGGFFSGGGVSSWSSVSKIMPLPFSLA
jgi:hypothetical protein